jgi:hypothetical protein
MKNTMMILNAAALTRVLRYCVGGAILASGIGACAIEPVTDQESIATDHEELYYLSTALWSARDVPVCWETAGDATEKGWVKQALRGHRSWSSAGNINFVGWGACGGSTSGIHLRSGTTMSTSRLGEGAGATVITLDFNAPESTYTRCADNALTREQCIKTVSIHEFGHAIGYAHEQNRGNAPDECEVATPQGTNGNATFGSWDVESIVAYCNFSTELSSMDRAGTERLYGPPLRGSSRLSDYNGDGRADLLCADAVNGSVFTDYASSTGQFGGGDWSAALNWCNATDTRRLFTGDFNGDNRDDMFCFDMDSGSVFLDYADVSGHFGGTDWSAAPGWCNAADSRRLLIGDFNGDNRDDRLCFDTSSGSEWIDYADASGHLGVGDWSAAVGWCNATASRRLYVGDFNGDSHDDLFCHDLVTGEEFIDYASAAGQFGGTNWSADAGWCNFAGASISIGDFNGDGRDDLVCHSAASGNRWVDLANTSGQFGATDWSAGNTWCRANGDRMFVGDANGDGRDDLVCHNVGSGTKRVDYADASGHFAGSDWSLADGWCNVDSRELH